MRTIILILFSLNLSFAQNISVKGKVLDSSTGKPVIGAIVYFEGNSISYTGQDGFYEIGNLQQKNYNVRISHLGYKTLFQNIKINLSNSEINFFLEPSPIKLDDIIVVVERSEKFLKDSPFSITLTDKEQIESKNFQSISDILEYEPGISAIRDGVWSTDINIRGLSRNNIVTVIDGTRIETANDISARLSLIDLNDVERIEVIKGAASSYYGSGATGGIVNIISKAPTFHENYLNAGNISVGYNSVNNLRTFAGNLFNSGSFWSSKLSGSFRKAGNTKTPVGELKNSQFQDYSLSGSLNLKPIYNHIFKLNYQLFNAEDVGIPGAAPLFPENADVRYPNEKRELFSAGYEILNLSSVLSKITLRYSHQFILRDVENIPNIVQNVPPRRISVLKIAPRADHNSHNFLAQTNLILSENNLLTLGFDYWSRSYNGERLRYQLIETLDSTGTTVINTLNKVIAEKPLPDSRFQSIGIFAQDDFQVIDDKLKLSLGARVDKIDISGETTYNPVYEINNGEINYNPPTQKLNWEKTDSDDISYSSNIGFNFAALSYLDLTLSLGYAFRSPSLEERFQYIDLGSLIRVGDPNLKPEKGYSADFGIRYYASDIKIISSLFYNYITDIVVEKPGTFEERPAQIKTNIGKARLYGLDLLVNYNIYKDWMVYLTTAYVKGDDLSENKNLPQIPPLNGTVGLKASLNNFISAEISSSIYDAQNTVAPGEVTTPGYAIFNFAAHLKNLEFSSVNFQLYCGVENILDKTFRNHLSTTRGGITVEPGRNFYLRLVTGW